MSNDYNNYESAIEIYRIGYREKKLRKDLLPSRQFFIKLRAAIISELETMGFCELADYIIENNIDRLDIVAYSVFADIAYGYEKNKLTDVENDFKYSDIVPYVKVANYGTVSWSECRWIGEHTFILGENVISTIRKARHVVRMKHIEGLENNRNTSNKDEMDSLFDVKKEADKIIVEARKEADRIINDSRLEAERINESARFSASTVIDEANSKAKAIAKQSSDKLVEQYLLAEQKIFKRELNEEISRYTSEYLENSKRATTTHIEMCDASNAFQVKWIQTLDAALSQMTAIKTEFYEHIHKWQVSLFPSEIKPIAERYLELYKIINVDKLLREAILFENTDCTVANEENQNAIIMGLQRLNKTLMTFLRRFEVALNGLDLYVYYPKAGDMFDDMWHTPDDEEDEYYGKCVTECVVPGIAKKANDNCGDDVLIPAVVKVEMEN